MKSLGPTRPKSIETTSGGVVGASVAYPLAQYLETMMMQERRLGNTRIDLKASIVGARSQDCEEKAFGSISPSRKEVFGRMLCTLQAIASLSSPTAVFL